VIECEKSEALSRQEQNKSKGLIQQPVIYPRKIGNERETFLGPKARKRGLCNADFQRTADRTSGRKWGKASKDPGMRAKRDRDIAIWGRQLVPN